MKLRLFLFFFVLVFLNSSFAVADKTPWKLISSAPWGLDLGGWLQVGYHSKNTSLINQHPNSIQLHQAWFYVHKEPDLEKKQHFGFRLDVLAGVDAQDTQAFGNNPGKWDYQNGFDRGAFGFSIPQAYLIYKFPFASVKAGHFYTLEGYEEVISPDNFFYSHAYTMYNSEPFTHTGVLASVPLNNLEIFFGWTLGWDAGFDQLNGGSSLLSGIKYHLKDNLTFTYINTWGNLGWRGVGYSHSIVLDYQITKKLDYVLQSDYSSVSSITDDTKDYGINQYLLYMLNHDWEFGLRLEWWKDQNRSYYETTFGVNYHVSSNLRFRPELRYDWSPAVNTNEFSYAADVVFNF